MLRYFDEVFNSDDCHHTCDNCATPKGDTKVQDMTLFAQDATRLVKDLAEKDFFTLLHCCDVFRGGLIKKVKEAGHDKSPHFGKGSSLERGDTERLFQHLVLERVFSEHSEVNAMGFATAYIRVNFTIPPCLFHSSSSLTYTHSFFTSPCFPLAWTKSF